MDFRQQSVALDALDSLACDALLVIVAGDKAPGGLDSATQRALDDAVAHGEFEFKRGKTVYLHRPQGLKAARLVFAACGAATPKSVKAAFASGLGALKGGGSKHVAVALAGVTDVGGAHAEALVAAASDASYVYRHTKPSAPAAGALAKVTLLSDKAAAKAVTQGLARGNAIAAGVTLARELGNRPGNHCTPRYLGEQAKKLGREFGLKVEVMDRKAIEKLGMGSFLAVAQGSAEPPRFIVAQYHGAPKTQAPVVLVGKGITFDTGGISLKPVSRDGRDEVRHGRRRERAGHAARRRRAQAQAQPRRAGADHREHAGRPRHQAGRRGDEPVGPDHRDPQHRCRRPPDPVRCADLRRALQAGLRGRRGHAHRRMRDRAGPPPLGPVQRRRQARR